MIKSLAEFKYGHGALKHSNLRHKIKRFIRPQLGKSAIPFDWTKPISIPSQPIKDQGTSSTCGRQAAAYLQFILQNMVANNQGQISAKSGYGRYCASGGGMTLGAVETSIGAYGANLEKDVPSYDVNGNPLSESMMEEQSWETPTTVEDAMKRAGYTAVTVAIDKDSMAEAIRDYGGIIMMIEGQNGQTPSWLSPTPQPPSKSNQNPLWAHYMCGAGTTTSKIAFYQSWGDSVGQNGIQFFDETYLNSGYVVDCISFIRDTEIASLPSNMSVWDSLRIWFSQMGL